MSEEPKTPPPEKNLSATPLQIMDSPSLEKLAMSVDELKAQKQLIQQIKEKNMKPEVHYGVQPGRDRLQLRQPGAEIINLVFRLCPKLEIERAIEERDFIAYTIRCSLIHVPTGKMIATGIGSCNSRESRYRFKYKSTGIPVPRGYWDRKDPKLLMHEGKKYHAKKIDDKWVLAEKIENDNPWDEQHSILGIAGKRATVAATRAGTAASDIFDQAEDENGTSNGHQPSQDQKKTTPREQGPPPEFDEASSCILRVKGKRGAQLADPFTGEYASYGVILKGLGFEWNPEEFVWEHKGLTHDKAMEIGNKVNALTTPDGITVKESDLITITMVNKAPVAAG